MIKKEWFSVLVSKEEYSDIDDFIQFEDFYFGEELGILLKFKVALCVNSNTDGDKENLKKLLLESLRKFVWDNWDKSSNYELALVKKGE